LLKKKRGSWLKCKGREDEHEEEIEGLGISSVVSTCLACCGVHTHHGKKKRRKGRK
jgi:hypothetical protein